MSWVTIISFIICFLIILSFFRPNTDIFSPGRIFAFIWTFAFGLCNLKFSGLQHEWPPVIWIQLLLGPVSFLIGVFFVNVINIGNRVSSLNELRSNRQIFEIDHAKLFKSTIILFALFLIAYGAIYLKTHDIPLFSKKPWLARTNFEMFGVGLFLHNVILVLFFTGVYSVMVKKNRIRKGILILISLISIILYAITLQRFQIFLSIFTVLIFLYYSTFRINVKTIILTTVLLIVLFYLVSSIRAGEIIVAFLYHTGKMKFPFKYALFTEPYMYVVMNLENYAREISRIDHYSYGFYSFDFITAITGLKHWMKEYFCLPDFPYLISTYFNTSSAFWTIYRDFGVLGIFILPFAGGFALNSLYYSFMKNPSLQKLAFYGILLFAAVFSFFDSIIGYLWFEYNLLMIFLVFKYISSPKLAKSYTL
jgi:oligosaccharide repeat unit polymerase